MKRILFFLLSGMIWIFACAPRVVYMPVNNVQLPPRSNDTPIPVFTDSNPPPKPYRVIGMLIIDEEVDIFNFTQLTESKIIKKLKQEARKHGADALYIGELKSDVDIVPRDIASASADVRLTRKAGAYAIAWLPSNNSK